MLGDHEDAPVSFFMLPPAVPDSGKRDLLRRIHKLIAWPAVRAQAAPFFAPTGRPSIDPVVMVKMMLVGYLFAIPSDRRLVEECADSFAIREFLGYQLDEKLPTHPNFTNWRQRLGAEFFRGLLHDTVRELAAAGVEFSTGRSVDATAVKAQASKEGPLVERPVDVPVDEFLAAYFAADAPAGDAPAAAGETAAVNLHDPQARLQRKRGEIAEFRYQVSFCADLDNGLITDATATPRERAATALEHVTRDPLPVTELAADKLYDHGPTLEKLAARGVTAYVPKVQRDKPGQISKDDFTYQPDREAYVCPQGHELKHSRFDVRKQLHYYTAQASVCRACPRKGDCTPAKRRTVTRTAAESGREGAVRAGPRYLERQRRRRVNEHLNMLGKRDHNLRRARALGLEAMRIQAALTALAINLKKTAARGVERANAFFGQRPRRQYNPA
ncbi:MAG TPA: transposase [Armatimonadota bacterium]|jgi:transposase